MEKSKYDDFGIDIDKIVTKIVIIHKINKQLKKITLSRTVVLVPVGCRKN